jgi:hypothetical protein
MDPVRRWSVSGFMAKKGGEEGGGTDSGVWNELGTEEWVLCERSVGGDGVAPCGGGCPREDCVGRGAY